MLLSEVATRQPEAYKPTEHERKALAIVIVSDTPQMADMQLSRDEKLNYSKENLVDMGFLADINGGIELTDTGNALISAQALTDDSGQPSEEAQQLAAS